MAEICRPHATQIPLSTTELPEATLENNATRSTSQTAQATVATSQYAAVFGMKRKKAGPCEGNIVTRRFGNASH